MGKIRSLWSVISKGFFYAFLYWVIVAKYSCLQVLFDFRFRCAGKKIGANLFAPTNI